MSPPPPWWVGGKHIVLGSMVVGVVCVIPCERDNFWGILNLTFKWKCEPELLHETFHSFGIVHFNVNQFSTPCTGDKGTTMI